MTHAEMAIIAVTAIGSLGTAAGALLVWRQLTAMVAEQRISALMAVLTLEESISRARGELSDAAAEAARIANDQSMNDVSLKIAKARYEEKTEQYLNTMDRLCACIVRGLVDEETYRQDYRPGLAEIVKQHAQRFGPDTRHRNILKVHQAWSEDRLIGSHRH